MSTLSSASGGTVKLQCGDNIHYLSHKQLSWQDLVGTTQKLFKIPPEEKNLVFKYRDDEGDLITIANEEELRLAQTKHSTRSALRLYVDREGKDKEIAEIWEYLRKERPTTDQDEIQKLTWKLKLEKKRYKKYKKYAKEEKEDAKRDKKQAKKHKRKAKNLKKQLKDLKGESTEEEKQLKEKKEEKKERKRQKKIEKQKRKDEKYERKRRAKKELPEDEEEEESDDEEEEEEEEEEEHAEEAKGESRVD